jgi:hypothetical protein
VKERGERRKSNEERQKEGGRGEIERLRERERERRVFTSSNKMT